MNNPGLKRAAKACLNDARPDPKKVLFIYLIVLLGLDVGYSLISTLLERGMETTAGGFGALRFLKGYNSWFVVAPLVVQLVAMLWNAGYNFWALKTARGEEAGTDALYEGFHLFTKVVWLTVLEAVFIFLWSLLFIIPGIIAAYRYRLAIYVLLDDQDLTASEAINVSKRLTSGHKLELFILDLSFWWYYLLIALASSFTLAENFSTLLGEYEAGVFPHLTTWQTFLAYLGSELVVMVVYWFFLPYVQTTYAHAYLYLRQLGDSRYMGNQAPDTDW